MEYNIHGGVNTITGDAEKIEVHGGVLYVKGNVETLVHHGGVLYDQRPSTRVEYRTDRMSEEERCKYRQRIADLERKLSRCESECLKLREKLEKVVEEQPDDDVLFRRINTLDKKLIQEREAHRKEVDELNWRLEAVTEIANGRNRKLYEDETNGHFIGVTDYTLDVLFTLINEYPISIDRDLAEDYGISMSTLKYIAKVLNLVKSPEQRREARDKLKRHGIDLVERRGGDQGNHTYAKPIEKVSRNGRVIATYASMKEAVADNPHGADTIRTFCQKYGKKTRTYTKEGYTFRYKKHNNKN